MARVFSAVDIEDDEVLEELTRVQDIIDLGFNTVPKQKMHITLQFFQDINQDEIEKVKRTMEKVSVEPFSARITGLGAFPSKEYIRVIWAGIKSREIHDLYRQVSSHEVDSDNNHDFNPHITLARVKNISPEKKKKLQKSLEEFQKHKFGSTQVNKVKLFESRLTGKDSKYKVIDEVKL